MLATVQIGIRPRVAAIYNGRQARWAIALAAYDFIIKHRAGKMNPVDVLSRRPLGAGGPLGRRYYATIDPKDFGNAGPLTRGERPIRCTVQGSEPSAEVLLLNAQVKASVIAEYQVY